MLSKILNAIADFILPPPPRPQPRPLAVEPEYVEPTRGVAPVTAPEAPAIVEPAVVTLTETVPAPSGEKTDDVTEPETALVADASSQDVTDTATETEAAPEEDEKPVTEPAEDAIVVEEAAVTEEKVVPATKPARKSRVPAPKAPKALALDAEVADLLSAAVDARNVRIASDNTLRFLVPDMTGDARAAIELAGGRTDAPTKTGKTPVIFQKIPSKTARKGLVKLAAARG